MAALDCKGSTALITSLGGSSPRAFSWPRPNAQPTRTPTLNNHVATPLVLAPMFCSGCVLLDLLCQLDIGEGASRLGSIGTG